MKEYIKDPDQEKIVDFFGGQALVLAAPGCGKTDVLSRRIVKAHRDYAVDYSEMLCITFTNRASREMKERIEETLGDIPSNLYVGNLHRFCIHFLFDNELVPLDTSLIDDTDQQDIITELLGYTPKAYEISQALDNSCKIFEEDNHFPVEMRLHANADYRGSSTGRQYYEYKKENGMIDFDDVLMLTYKIMSSPDYDRSKYIMSSYSWIQVDEVQDLNPLQFALIEFLKTSNPTVLYLGDERQAIYGFLGADEKSIAKLKQRYNNNIFRLSKNFRSPLYLLDMLNDYAVSHLGISSENLPTTINTQHLDDALIVVPCSYEEEQYSVLATLARDIYFKAPNESVGILVRNNNQAEALSAKLDEHNISHLTITKKDMFKMVDFKTIYSHLSVVVNDTRYSEWARVLYQTKVIEKLGDARKCIRKMRDLSLSPTDLLFYSESSYSYEFCHSYNNKEIVIFDTETTGLNVFEDDIIQIAAIKIRNGFVVEGSELDIIIETNKEIPPYLKKDFINPMVEEYKRRKSGIRNNAFEHFMDAQSAFDYFINYVGDAELLGHNVNYDIHILENNIRRRTNLNFVCPIYWDTLKLSRLLDSTLRKHTLEELLKIYNLPGTNSHNAMDDILATKSLAKYCEEKLALKLNDQLTFLSHPILQKIQSRMQKNYYPIYKHTLDKLYDIEISEENSFNYEFDYVYRALLEKKYIKEIRLFEYMKKLFDKVVIDHKKDLYFNQQLVNHIYEFRTFNEADLYQNDIINEHVHIMTIHKSKGLEFENVLIHNVTEGVIPHYRSSNPIEDARVLYVAMSRAKKRVWMTYERTLSRFITASTVYSHFEPMLEGKKDKLLKFEESFVQFSKQN